MKVAVYKVNLTTCEDIYLGRYDEKPKALLRGYKETKYGSGIYECENTSWIYYIEKFD